MYVSKFLAVPFLVSGWLVSYGGGDDIRLRICTAYVCWRIGRLQFRNRAIRIPFVAREAARCSTGRKPTTKTTA